MYLIVKVEKSKLRLSFLLYFIKGLNYALEKLGKKILCANQ